MAGIYSQQLHGSILAREKESGALHARVLLESPSRALEVIGPFCDTFFGADAPIFNAIAQIDNDDSATTSSAHFYYHGINNNNDNDFLRGYGDEELEMMRPTEALPDMLVLFLKDVSAAAAKLRRRIYKERMLLLCGLASAFVEHHHHDASDVLALS